MTRGYIVRIGSPLASDVLHVALADPDVALKLRAMLLVQTPRTRKSDHWWLGAGEPEQLELVPRQMQKRSCPAL